MCKCDETVNGEQCSVLLFTEKSKQLSPKSQCSQLPCPTIQTARSTKFLNVKKIFYIKKSQIHLYTDFS